MIKIKADKENKAQKKIMKEEAFRRVLSSN